VTTNSANVLDAGIPVYVTSIGVGTANAFVSVFVTGLIVVAVYMAVCALGWGVGWGWRWWMKRRRGGKGEEMVNTEKGVEADEGWMVYYPWWVKSWGVRVVSFWSFSLSFFVRSLRSPYVGARSSRSSCIPCPSKRRNDPRRVARLGSCI
jgi:hypothetical protein